MSLYAHRPASVFFLLISVFLNKRTSKGRHDGVKEGPPLSCRFLPGKSVGLFICNNAIYVSLCHLAGVSLRPVVDQWQCQMHSSVTSSGSNPGKLDSRCQIIQLCVTVPFFPALFLRFVVVFFYYCRCLAFSMWRMTFCNGIFNITTILFYKMRYILIFDVKVVRCSQRNNKTAELVHLVS